MRKSLSIAAFLMATFILQYGVSAYFNATYLSTTVSLSNSTTAHIVETITLYVSNSSIATYNQDRQAVNLTLNGWQQAVGSSLFSEHIYNPRGSISNFTYLPGPRTSSGGGYATLTMSYYASNVTTVTDVAPRKFDYAFNNTVFSFMHTASGESLFSDSALKIIIPSGASLVSVYPAPDSPLPNALGGYANSTTFSWNSGEPLQKFTLVYVTTETPQQEVLRYFSGLYESYTDAIYALVAVAIVAIVAYVYAKTFR